MAAVNLNAREQIGSDQFSQRREVFGQHDSVFYPPASPSCLTPTEFELRRGAGFRRAGAYSSMRETRREDLRTELGFRERKMSDNCAELNQSDIDYRRSMTERTRRISKLRQEFLTSNLHEPSPSIFVRGSATRSSLPAPSLHGTYRLRDTGVYKFPFAEPYGTPPSSRKTMLNGDVNDSADEDVIKNYFESRSTTLADLMKKYSPSLKPIDMKLPPTKPRVVGAIDKKTADGNNIDQLVSKARDKYTREIELMINENASDDEKIAKQPQDSHTIATETSQAFINNEKIHTEATAPKIKAALIAANVKQKQEIINAAFSAVNGEDEKLNGNIKEYPDVTGELDDKVPEIPKFVKQNSHPRHNVPSDEDIPALLEKISQEESSTSPIGKKSKKNKRSFLDKLLNRKKNK